MSRRDLMFDERHSWYLPQWPLCHFPAFVRVSEHPTRHFWSRELPGSISGGKRGFQGLPNAV